MNISPDDLAGDARLRGVPEHLIDGLVLYVTHGYRPGSFLSAVLANDLMGAINNADPESAAGLVVALCRFITHAVPAECHGSRAYVAAWSDAGGLQKISIERMRWQCQNT